METKGAVGGTLAASNELALSRPAPDVCAEQLERCVERAQQYLLRRQHPDGYWAGELYADASVPAGYVPLMHLMTGAVDPARERKVVEAVFGQQRSDGSWALYHGGPADLNVGLQAYLALKMAGIAGADPRMKRAREVIVGLGGIARANVITKIWLALFDQYPWAATPTVPPELVLLPESFALNIYEFSSWSRATIVALSVVLTQRPLCHLPASAHLRELWADPGERARCRVGESDELVSWKSFFLGADALLKAWERLPLKPMRKLALQRTERWILEHQEADGSWGGIMLPWLYSLVALKSLGYSNSHHAVARGLKGIEGFLLEDERRLHLQPATSPVWDTAWSVLALSESGLPADHPALCKAARWLLDQEIRVGGDWRVKNRHAEPGCWSFEHENDLYPDLDDTAVVARALRRVRLDAAGEEAKGRAVRRATSWVLSMQCRDGGWAAFDKDNNRELLTHLPFADFMTPLDPTCADVTGHVLELLGELGHTGPALHDALAYLRRTQEPDGAWYGRWGVNYLYGTGLAVVGLAAADAARGQTYVQRALAWLERHQNDDGGWGESCRSYADPHARGRGESTASQTAWALNGLIAAHGRATPAAQAGVGYLLGTQSPEGDWKEQAHTGTGFPRAFYLRYDMYRVYFPLVALGRFRRVAKR